MWRVWGFLFYITVIAYVFVLGVNSQAADTVSPVYETVGSSGIERERGESNGEAAAPTVGKSGQEEEEGAAPKGPAPTVGKTGETIGVTGVTLGASSPAPGPEKPIDYTRFIPLAIAFMICYKTGTFVYHCIVDAVWD